MQEALLRLESDGLLQIVPKKGAYVRPITEAEVESVMQARGLVEDWCARQAAHRAQSDPAGRSPFAASFPERMLLAAPEALTASLAAVVAPVLAAVVHPCWPPLLGHGWPTGGRQFPCPGLFHPPLPLHWWALLPQFWPPLFGHGWPAGGRQLPCPGLFHPPLPLHW